MPKKSPHRALWTVTNPSFPHSSSCFHSGMDASQDADEAKFPSAVFSRSLAFLSASSRTIFGNQSGCQMLISSMRDATLKYLTRGSSGVDGLNTSLRYEVVRFAYAGESMRVVKEEGRVESDKRKTASRFSDAPFRSVDDIGSGSGRVCRSWSLARWRASSSCLRPRPRYCWSC